ncbi:hypothetical protein V9T40_013762 [Parthenolecanium corni]|uniref:Uncharacterized protein n=1 Tax=Parthenolecanium corni TaxID=536013 RepID=A0AAN9TDD0_9HEMI
MLCTLTFSSLLLVSNAIASHHYSKRIHRPSENEIDNNLQDTSDISASASSAYGASFPHHRDSYIPPAPFTKQHQYPRTLLHAPTNKRLRQEQMSLDDKTDFTGGSSVGYILTAGGREKIYDGEGETKIAPHATPFASSPYAKKYAFDKSFKKYRFAYSNLGTNNPIVVNPIGGSNSTLTPPPSPDDKEPKDSAIAGTAPPDTAISRTFNALLPVAPNSGSLAAHHKFYNEKTDLYGSKGTVWKQLGPNVEISSAAEHIPFTRQINAPKERKKSKASSQQRKNGPKNLRSGFMTSQQHALYVANNLKGFKGNGGANFDHSNVLRQSDKFELTDAMISEAEKEEALKNTKPLRVRFKQELPSGQSQPVPFQSVDQYDASPQSIQYYSQANTPFSLMAAHGVPLALNSFSPQLGTLGKGFVRHIEVEMSGTRKMVPALIIPLGPEVAANYINNEVATAPASVFVSHPDRHAKPAFPYDIVAPRYVHHPDAINTIASSATAESYHLQPIGQFQYQYKTQLGDESSYNPYTSPHYHNHNLYNTRFAFMNSNGGGATTAPTNLETTNSGGTTSAAHDKRPSRYSASHSSAHAHQSIRKPAQHLVAEQSEQKPVTLPPSVTSIATFIYDADNAAAGTAHAYLAPSESSYFATMASTRDETRPSRLTGTKQFEKNNVRRDK